MEPMQQLFPLMPSNLYYREWPEQDLHRFW